MDFGIGFLKQIVATSVTRGLVSLLGFITTVFIARFLGPEGRGLYAVAVTLGAMGVQLSNVGMHASNTYFAVREPGSVGALMKSSLRIGAVMGFSIAIIFWAVFSIFHEIAPLRGAILLLALSWIPVGLTYMLLQGLFLAVHAISDMNRIDLFNKLGVLLSVIGIFSIGYTGVDAVFLCNLVLLAACVLWQLQRLDTLTRGANHASSSDFRTRLRYGGKAYLSGLFSFIAVKVDLLLVQQLVGPAQAGYYSIALAIADVMLMLPIVVGTLLFPRLANISNDVEKKKLATKTIRTLALAMLALLALAALLVGILVPIFFGEAFAPTIPVFYWLMPAIFAMAVNSVYMNYFAAIGMPAITVYSPAIGAIVNIVLNLHLVPTYGLKGAAIASGCAYWLMLALSLLYVRRRSSDR